MDFLLALSNNGIIQFLGMFCVIASIIALSFVVDVVGGVITIGVFAFLFSGGNSWSDFDGVLAVILWILAGLVVLVLVGTLVIALISFLFEKGEGFLYKTFISILTVSGILIISCGSYGYLNGQYQESKNARNYEKEGKKAVELAKMLPICKATNLAELKASGQNLVFVKQCEEYFKEDAKLDEKRKQLGIPTSKEEIK